jgi:hypothetical protein
MTQEPSDGKMWLVWAPFVAVILAVGVLLGIGADRWLLH